MQGTQVLVGRVALGEVLQLARTAAFALRASDPILSDALTGAAAEAELTVFAPPERVPC